MIEIPLTRGFIALIDEQDADLILGRALQVQPAGNGKLYAVGRSKPDDGVTTRQVKMHRLIMRAPPKMVVDHLDSNGLNNRRGNMRVVTQSMNLRNTDVARNARPYRRPTSARWFIFYSDNNRRIHESFVTEGEAWHRLREVHIRLGWLAQP